MRTATLSQLSFFAAATAWLESRRYHLAPRTFKSYEYHIRDLNKFFQDMRVQDITGDDVRLYQRKRRETVSPGVINKELGILIMMRERMGMAITDYQRLPQSKDWEPVGRALEDDEKSRIIEACMSLSDHTEWGVAALATLLSLYSGMAPCEMLSLKLKHCSLDPSLVTVPRSGAKRIKRERPVMLGEQGAWVLRKLIERAARLGCCESDHFLFPYRHRDHSYDPALNAKGYRGGMRQILKQAGVKMRRYDCRHTSISTALADPNVSREDAIEHFGWINPNMIPRYYHAKAAGLRKVAAAIEKKPNSVDFISKLLKTG